MGRQGNAAFTWTTADGQSAVHRLGAELRDLQPVFNRPAFSHQSADLTAINTVQLGTGVWEIQTTVRYDALPEALLNMMDDAVAQQTLRYWPDLTKRDYMDAKLVPAGGSLGLAPDSAFWFKGEYQVTILLRRTDGNRLGAVQYGTVLNQRVVLRLEGGESLADHTFSRTVVTGADTYVDRDGVVQEITTSGVARTEWLDADSDGYREVPVLLTEAGGDNFVPYSEDWSNWKTDGTPTSGATHTATGITLTLIGDDASGAVEKYYDDRVATTTTGKHILRVRVKEGASPPATNTQVIVYEGTGTGTVRAWVTIDSWTNGVPAWDIAGSGTKLATVTVDAVDGVYDLYIETDSLASGTNRIDVLPAAGASQTGNIYMGGVVLSEQRMSYIKTVGTAVAQNAEVLYLDLPVGAQTRDGPWAVYLRGYERGNISRAGTLTLLSLANSTTSVAEVRSGGAGTGYSVQAGSGGTALTAAPTYGQAVELVLAHDGAGTYTLDQSVAGGAVETESDALSRPASAPDRLYLNSAGGSQGGQFAWRNVVMVTGDITSATGRITAFRRYVDQG